MQLNLKFESLINKNPYAKEDFVLLPENSKAFNVLKDFFAQNQFVKNNSKTLILQGENASGKTHLLHIFADEMVEDFLNYDEISKLNLSNFFVADKFYILEDIDEIKDEEFLFHLLNSAFSAGSFLVLSAVNLDNFSLKDLKSRLRNIVNVEIKNPSLESMKQLLVYAFSRRQIKLDNRIINFIADNIDRNYQAIYEAVGILELKTLQDGKKITMQEVRDLFGEG